MFPDTIKCLKAPFVFLATNRALQLQLRRRQTVCLHQPAKQTDKRGREPVPVTHTNNGPDSTQLLTGEPWAAGSFPASVKGKVTHRSDKVHPSLAVS